MSGLTCLTYSDDFVIEVTDLTDRSLALDRNVSHFSARHFKSGHSAFFCHKLSSHARASRDLTALAGLKFDVVNHRTDGDKFKRKGVADFDIGVLAGYEFVAYVKTERSENISLFSVLINEKGDVCRSVRIVFDRLDRRFDSVFISLEIDDTIFSLIAAAVMTNGDSSLSISACGMSLIFKQRSFGLRAGNLFKRRNRHKTTSRGSRFISLNSHNSDPPYYCNDSKNLMPLLSFLRVTIAFL